MTEEPENGPELLVERRGNVLIMQFNRPQARNAMSLAMAEQIAAALEDLDQDPELSVGVLTGAHGIFCAGMDLKDFAAGRLPVIEGRGFGGLVRRPPRKPLIAAVEGYALAGGFEMVLSCDLIVAARSAKFGLPEVKRGLTAAAGGLFRLPRRIPYHLAMELALTGRFWEAPDAAEAGLVNRLVDKGGALDAAVELAGEIAANAPMALTASKQVITESADWPQSESFDRQEAIVDPVRKSDDAMEGAKAFAEKRAPQWTGR